MTGYADADIAGHYRTLGLEPEAPLREIKKAARRLFLTHHPDLSPDNRPRSEERIRAVIHAYKTLVALNADRAAADACDPADAEPGSFEILVFEIAQRLFALPLRQVREVLRAGDIRIDDVGIVSEDFPFIAGAFYRNGELVMLWNLHRQLNLSEIPITSDFGKNKLIIAEYDASLIGLATRDIRGMASVSRASITPHVSPDCESAYLRGVARTDHGPAGLLNLGDLLYNAL